MQKPSNGDHDRVLTELTAENARLRSMVTELKAEIFALKAASRDYGYGSTRRIRSRPKRLPPQGYS
jgi:hypothetical protein